MNRLELMKVEIKMLREENCKLMRALRVIAALGVALFFGLLMLLLAATARGAELIEHVRGSHVVLTTGTQLQAETGLYAQCISNVSLTTNSKYNATALTDGKPNQGNFAGYSRYTNVNSTGEYAFALSTGDDGSLWRTSDGKFMGMLRGGSGFRIFESRDPRWDWSGRPGRATILRYCFGKNIYEQDVLVGPSSERVIGTLPYAITSKGDADWSRDGQYFPVVMVVRADQGGGVREIDRVGVFDAVAGALLPGTMDFDLATSTLNGTDMSPDGRWLWVQQRYYRMDDLRAGVTASKSVAIRGGHGDWAMDVDGLPVYVWQESAVDQIMAYKPDTEALFAVMGHDELGWCGLHISGAMPGWVLVSTYPGYRQTWAASQIFFLQIKPTNRYQRPEYDKTVTSELWRSGYLPDDEQPKIRRLLCTNNDWYGYFSECAANCTPDGKLVSFGSNRNSRDNLEVFVVRTGARPVPTATPSPTPMATLTPVPADHAVTTIYLDGPATITITRAGGPVVTPEPTAEPTATPTPTPTPKATETPTAGGGGVITLEAAACNSLYWGKDSLSGSTRGNYHTVIRIRPRSWSYLDASGTTRTSSFDQVWQASYHHTSIVARWELTALAGKRVTRARLRLDARNPAGASDGGTLPMGDERIAIRTLAGSQDWTPAYLIPGTTTTREVDWNGASFLNRSEIPNGSGGFAAMPWSALPSNLAKYGRTGDITSVRGPVVGEISFAADRPSWSSDLAPAINAALAAGQTQFSIYLDPDSALGTTWTGNKSNLNNPKFGSHVALYPLTASDPAQRPALIIETE